MKFCIASFVVLNSLVAYAISASSGDCTFESGLCGYTQDSNDHFDWSNNTGPTPSSFTGPTADHTTGQGTYMYIETSWPRLNKESAILVSPAISDRLGNCLGFYYHMNGYNTRALNVFIQYANGARTLMWSLKGDQYSKNWSFARVELPLPRTNLKVVFEGISGTSYMADIAIDDIKIYDDPFCLIVPSSATPTTVTTVNHPLPKVSSCGIKPSGTRIVGGTEATPGEWPWQAMLMYYSSSGKWKQFCGGTLVTPDWVVTASHCVDTTAPSDLSTIQVRMGAHYINHTTGVEQDLAIEKIYLHEDYNAYPFQYDNDIALIKLKTPAKLDSRTNIACIPDNTIQFSAGTYCYITGWGTTKSGGESPLTLQGAKTPIVSNNECTKNGSYDTSLISSHMLCAGYPGKGGVDTCQGDSGGPFVCVSNGRWYLVGITSWGYSCADPLYPGVYARVQALQQWMANTMANHV